MGAPASPSGSRASHEARADLHPAGFDPSRVFALLPELRIAEQEFEAARRRWHDAIGEAQSNCAHAVWICQDGYSGPIFNHPSIQICAQCRAEVQTGTYSGWAHSEWRRPAFVKLVVTPTQAGAKTVTACRLRDDPRVFQTASAIEARSGETTKIGSTEGESATRQGDAQ